MFSYVFWVDSGIQTEPYIHTWTPALRHAGYSYVFLTPVT